MISAANLTEAIEIGWFRNSRTAQMQITPNIIWRRNHRRVDYLNAFQEWKTGSTKSVFAVCWQFNNVQLPQFQVVSTAAKSKRTQRTGWTQREVSTVKRKTKDKTKSKKCSHSILPDKFVSLKIERIFISVNERTHEQIRSRSESISSSK